MGVGEHYLLSTVSGHVGDFFQHAVSWVLFLINHPWNLNREANCGGSKYTCHLLRICHPLFCILYPACKLHFTCTSCVAVIIITTFQEMKLSFKKVI